MDTNIIINDYIEEFDIDNSNFNDFMVMSKDFKSNELVNDIDLVYPTFKVLKEFQDLPF